MHPRKYSHLWAATTPGFENTPTPKENKMLTPFDQAVIAYANSRGEDSATVYQRIDKLTTKYRDNYTLTELLALLDHVKQTDQEH